jgi:hypothetical protein
MTQLKDKSPMSGWYCWGQFYLRSQFTQVCCHKILAEVAIVFANFTIAFIHIREIKISLELASLFLIAIEFQNSSYTIKTCQGHN